MYLQPRLPIASCTSKKGQTRRVCPLCRRPRVARGILIAGGGAMFAAAVWAGLDRGNDGLSLLLVAAALLALGVAWLESGPDSAKEIALIAALGGAAAPGRGLFAALPRV